MEGTASIDPVFTEAMASLNIDASSLDDGGIEPAPVEPEDKEVEGETAEVEEGEESDAAEVQDPSPEGEEKAATRPEVVEEPKLTAKELQEIEAEKLALNAERENFHKEMKAKETEFLTNYQAKLEEHGQFDAFLDTLAANDPSLFELVKDAFSEHQKQYNNPLLSELRQRQAALEKELSGFKAKASDEVTLTKLDSEFNKFNSSIGKEVEAAGLKIDRKAIEDLWAKGLTVEEAFYAKYGAAYAKAQASKAKVETVEKKVAARPTVSTAGSVKRSSAPVEKDFSKMDSRATVGWFARQIAGKTA
jgi:hypothetical protein